MVLLTLAKNLKNLKLLNVSHCINFNDSNVDLITKNNKKIENLDSISLFIISSGRGKYRKKLTKLK